MAVGVHKFTYDSTSYKNTNVWFGAPFWSSMLLIVYVCCIICSSIDFALVFNKQ